MRKLLVLLAANAFVIGTAGLAFAYEGPVTAHVSVKIGSFPEATFDGEAEMASSAAQGGTATLPAGAFSGLFTTPIPPIVGDELDTLGVGAPGGSGLWPVGPASNQVLAWDGAAGTMALDASAYLMATDEGAGTATILSEIPLAVVGVGGTQMFTVFQGLVSGTIVAYPYQLGMLTLMGNLGTELHTIMGTGVDNRTAGGEGNLVLVSPNRVELGGLGTLQSIATLSLTYAPEPGATLLGGAAVASLVALGSRRKKQA